MKHRTATLEGDELNHAVALCEGYGEAIASYADDGYALWAFANRWNPSTDWGIGGPIIARERISIMPAADGQWHAIQSTSLKHPMLFDTDASPLVAAMRVYVARKLGQVVELP